MATTAARPPTPPRPASHDSPSSRLPVHHSGGARVLDSLTTPSSTLSSSAESSSNSRTRKAKRVNFSPWMDYLSPNQKVKDLQTSRLNERTFPKSILKSKATSSANTALPAFESMSEMLKSVLQELAGNSRHSRLDGYLVLAGTLRAHNEVPDREELKDKMGLICQYIRRDLTPTSTESEIVDTALVSHVLKLLAIFVWDSEISKLLTDDTRCFVIDRSIQALEDPQLPKSLTILHMSILATQKFSSKIMTGDRAQRLITALEGISDRVSGNNVVIQRLMIYLRLLEQARTIMATKAKNWIDHLLSGMFSSIKETRSRAIRFGMQAGLDLGSHGLVSDYVKDLLNMESEAGVKNATYFSERLIQMTVTRGDRDQVPQIWSVVILLLRGRRRTINDWEHLKEWLRVIQKCFNCSGPSTEAQTFLAWNRLVFAMGFEKQTSKSMIRLLRQPIASKFRLQAGTNAEKPVKPATLSSYCNLLYYAFRPGISSAQLDLFWDEYVSTIIKDSFLSNQENAEQACQILCSLLWNSQPVLWNENLANETKTLEAKDLPRLDCKWIRSKLSSVLQIVEALFQAANWEGDFGTPLVTQVWTCLTKALGEACSKEVKPTAETKQSIASTCNTLARIWNGQAASLAVLGHETADNTFVERFGFLLKTMLCNVGTFPFTETLLAKSSDGAFVITTTSPQRSLSQDTAVQPTIFHLIRLVSYNLNIGMPSSSPYHGMIRHILAVVLESRPSADSKLDFCRNLVEWIRDQTQILLVDDEAFGVVWQATAELACETLTSSPDGHRDASTRKDYSSVVQVLNIGIPLTPDENHRFIWGKLFQVIVSMLTKSKSRPEALEATKDLVKGLEEQEWYQSSGEQASGLLLGVESPAAVSKPVEPHQTTGRDGGSRASRRSKPGLKRRPRHDDSQIEFTVVESFPQDLRPDSQSLTGHQKEVKERQRDQARSTFQALWPNTAGQNSQNEQEEPRLPPILKISPRYDFEEDVPLTPTLAVDSNGSDDPFIGSSPTPGSRHTTPVNEGIEIPSSPPSIQDAQDPPSSPPAIDEDLPDFNELFSTTTERPMFSVERDEIDDLASSVNHNVPPHISQQAAEKSEDMAFENLEYAHFENANHFDSPVPDPKLAFAAKVTADVHTEDSLNRSHGFSEEQRTSGSLQGLSRSQLSTSNLVQKEVSVEEYVFAGKESKHAGSTVEWVPTGSAGAQTALTKTHDVEDSSSIEIVPLQPLNIASRSEDIETALVENEQTIMDASSDCDETEFLLSSQLSEDLERSIIFGGGLSADDLLPVANETFELLQDSKKRKRSISELPEEQQETIIVDTSTVSTPDRSSKKQKRLPAESQADHRDSTPERRRDTTVSLLGGISQEPRPSQVNTAVDKRRRASKRSNTAFETRLPYQRSGRTTENEIRAPDHVQSDIGTDAEQIEGSINQSNDEIEHSAANEAQNDQSAHQMPQSVNMTEAEPTHGYPSSSIRLRPTDSYPESMPTPPPSSPLIKPTGSTTNNEPNPQSTLRHTARVESVPAAGRTNVISTDRSKTAILSSLRGLLGQLKGASIDYQDLREIEDVMADVRKEAWDAVGRDME